MSDPAANPEDDTPELGIMIRFYVDVFGRHKRLIAVAFTVFLALAVVVLLVVKRKYEATALLLIIHEGDRPLNLSENNQSRMIEAEDYVPTHAQIVSSPLVVGRAIESIGVDKLPTLLEARESGYDPVETAINLIKVDRPDRMGKVVRVSYRAYSKREAIRTLQAIIDCYQRFLTESLTKNNNDVVRLIAKARDELSVELRALESKYLEFRQDKQLMLTDEKGRSFLAIQLEQLYRAANEAKIKAVMLKSQMELGRKLTKEGRSLWAIAHAMEQLAQAPSGTNLVTSLAINNQSVPLDYLRLMTTEQQGLTEKFGARNSRVKEIKDQLDRAREGVRESRRQLDKGEIEDLMAAVAQGGKATDDMTAAITKEFDKCLAEAKTIETDLLTDSNLRANLDRQRVLFDTVVGQLKQAQYMGDYSSYTAQTIEAPNWHFGAHSPRYSIVFGIALLLGGVSGTVGSLAADRLDRRLRSAAEVRKALGIQVVGQIARLPVQRLSEIGGAALVAESLPRSPWAEAYRRVRTNLQLLRKSRKVQVVMVTSPRPGDGTSTTASNLAISLAHAGRRVLLIDADLRDPSQHKIHGVSRRQGLVHILKDVLPRDRVTQRTAVQNLDLIPAGPEVPNPAELLSSSRLIEFLFEIRKMYDFVIIDSSPVLAVTDPTIIGAAVDGVLIVLGAPAILQKDAEQALEVLGMLGIPILGAFLNGVSPEAAGSKSTGYEEPETLTYLDVGLPRSPPPPTPRRPRPSTGFRPAAP